MKRQSQNQSCEPLVDEDRAVAVPPVQRKKAALARTTRLRLRRKILMAFAIRLALMYEPVEDIADRRLPSLQAELPGKHGFRHDATETGHIRQVLLHRRDHQVARGGADDLHEGTGLDPGADGAEVSIERACRHGNSFRQSCSLSS